MTPLADRGVVVSRGNVGPAEIRSVGDEVGNRCAAVSSVHWLAADWLRFVVDTFRSAVYRFGVVVIDLTYVIGWPW